jgi:hypothetical protein
VSTYRQAIWKYSLELVDQVQQVALPVTAEILHVADQDGKPTLWARVLTRLEDGREPSIEVRNFRVLVTGAQWEGPAGRYLGTCHHPTGQIGLAFGMSEIVTHVFELEWQP